MYKEFYGLREYPFNMTPDPQFLFLSRNHRVALFCAPMIKKVGSGASGSMTRVPSPCGNRGRKIAPLNPYAGVVTATDEGVE